MRVHWGWRRLVVGVVAVLGGSLLTVVMAAPNAHAADDHPVPTVSVSTDPSPLIGQSVGIDLTFSNTSLLHTGYGPYIDLHLPMGADLDDGLTFTGATYLGAAVTSTPLTAAGSDGPGGTACITHPYAVDVSGAPVKVCNMTIGEHYIVLRLPFGSFTPGQPAAVVHVTTQLSNLADAGAIQTIVANGGFQFGADPLADPATDPSVIGTPDVATINPTVISVRKTYIGPESETATGRNFPESYRIDVTVAPDQKVTSLIVADALPVNMQFLSVDSTTPDSSALLTPSTSTPGGTLSRDFGTVTGTGGTDATMTFHFYIPRLDASATAVLNASTGAFAPSIDSATASGSWKPIDPRDVTTGVSAGPATHTLTDKSVAIQKSVSISDDTGPAGASSGDTLQWTLAVQVSDYFALDNLIVDDLLGDGTRVDGGFTPTLAVAGNGFDSAAADLDAANFTVGTPDPGTGKTSLSFHVSSELLTRSYTTGRLVGGCIPLGGSSTPDCGTYDNGGTTVTIAFRSIIQQTFIDGHQVVEGDTLGNLAAVTADVLDTSTWAPTGSNIGDGSAAVATPGTGASISIERGTLEKSIYAIDGSTTFATPIHVSPGQKVTYRLKQTFPTSRTDDYRMIDYLPLPVFYASGVTTFDPTVSADAPPAGTAKYGPADTFSALSNGPLPADHAPTPIVSSNALANSVQFQYGDFALYPPAASTSDLLFTVTVSTDPFADGLLLTNQARSQTRNSQGTLSTADAIVQITLDQPVVTIAKGVVGTDSTTGTFTPATTGPVAFDATAAPPVGAPCPGWSGGDITTAGLAASPINSDLSGVDAGDYVRFAVVLENTGHSAAFDVKVADQIPAGFVAPSGGLDMCVRNGHGDNITFTNVPGGTGLFSNGIQLADGGSGSLAAGTVAGSANATGTNVVVITYTLRVATAAVPSSVVTNTASLIDFTNDTVASGHLASPLTDTATVTMATPASAKAVIADSLPNTVRPAVAIGETVTYTVTLTLPEGTLPNAKVDDLLPAGMTLVGCDSITPYSGGLPTSDVNTSLAGGFGDACHPVGATPPPLNPTVTGQDLVFDLGTLTNANSDNATAETVTIKYDAIVLNTAGNTRGHVLHNGAVLSWDGGSLPTVSAANLRVVEPLMTVTKNADKATGDAGDTITYTVVVSNDDSGDGSDAFNVHWSDALPSGMSFVSGSFAQSDGLAPTTISLSTDPAMSATWDTFPQGATATFTFSAKLDVTVHSNQTLTNRTDLAWTSLLGDFTLPQSTFSPVSTERTGDTDDPGDVLNTYAASDTADLHVPLVTVSKSMTGHNQPHTTGTAVAVGEILTYQVVMTIPEGTQPSAALTDTLPAGMALVGCDTISASPALSTSLTGGFTDACHATGLPPLDPTVAGQNVIFDLGTVVNADTENADTEMITIAYKAVVLNVPANTRGVAMHNRAVLSWTGGASAAATTPDVHVVEPIMTVAKSASPGNGDAGDTITFSVTVGNPDPGDGNGSTAFEAAWSDSIPTGLTYVADSLRTAVGCTAVPTTLVGAGAPNLSATWLTFDQGQNCTIQYDATFDAGVPSGSSYTNTATQTWTGLPGDVHATQSTFSAVANERSGDSGNPGGAVNGYARTDDATVQVNQPAPVKTIVTTSEAGTTDPTRLEVGEIVRFRVAVTIPESVTGNVSIRDALAPGLRFLNDNSARVALVTNDAGMTSSTLSDPSLPATGTIGWPGHPAYVLPGGAISGGSGGVGALNGFQSGDDPVFSVGELANLDRDVDAELLVIEFNVMVDNVPGNQSGVGLTDQASIWGGSTPADLGDSAILTQVVAEPSIVDGTSFYKQTMTAPTDAGDAIVYKITVTNTAGVNTSPAHEYRVLDTLPASVVAPPAPPDIDCAGGATDNSSGSSIDVTFAHIDPGVTCTITISSTIDPLAPAGKLFTNTATGSYSSLPGTTGTLAGNPGNDTGSTNPGPAAGATGERNGSGGVAALDDYVNTHGVSQTLAEPSIEKYPAGLANVTIGSTTTFDLVVTLPEGTTRGLTVNDHLPLGLTPIGYTVLTSGGRLGDTFAGTLAAATVTSTPVDPTNAGVRDWTFSFGDTVVPVNVAADQRQFEIQLTVLVANVTINQSGTVRTNTANVIYTSPQTGDPVSVGAPNSRDVTIYEPTLRLVKSAASITPRFTDDVTYTLTLDHFGGSFDMTAYDVTLVDTLPAGLTYKAGSLVATACASATTVGQSGTQITATFDTFPLATTCTLTYKATVGTPLSGVGLKQSLVNAAVANWTSMPGSVAGERTGVDGVNGALNDYRFTTTAPVTVSGVDMAVTKDDSNLTATAAAVRRYVVHYVNDGNQTASGVVLTETVPAGTVFNSGQSTGAWKRADNVTNCTGAAAGVVCHISIGNVVAAGNASWTFAVTVVDPIPSGTTQIVNTATVADDGTKNVDPTPANNTATDTDTIPVSDLRITKSVLPLRPNANQNVVYTITLNNDGPDNATNVRLTDLVPAGLSYQSSVPSQGTYTSGTGIWNIGTVNSGAFKTLTITARATSSAVVTNAAEVSHSDQSDPDSTPANGIIAEDDYATATTTPNVADTAVTKTVDVANPDEGSNVTFTITATNNGPDPATNAKVVDTLPAGLTFVSATPSTGSWAGSTWTIGTLNVGAPRTLTLVAHVANAGSITNTATVSADPFDLTMGNNVATASISQSLNLAVTKTVDFATPNVGDTVAFTIGVSNTGINAAHNVVIHDALPAGLTYASSTPSQGSYSSVTGNWTVGTIATSGSATLTLRATVAGNAAMTNTASVLSLDETQTSTADDSASATVTPQRADLAIVKTVDVVGPEIGDPVRFTLTLTNNGPDTATTVHVSDLLPAGLTFGSAVPSQGSYVDSSGVWTVGTMVKDASVTLVVNATVALGGSYINTAVAAGDQYDPVPANNTSSASLTSRMADIGVTKTVDDPTPDVGATVHYSLTVTNHGPDAASQLVVGDLLPAGLTLVSAPPSRGSYVASTGVWTIGALAVDGSVTMTVTARATVSGRIDNTLAFTSMLQTDLVPGNNSATATINVPSASDLAVTKTVDTNHPDVGSNVTFTIVATNNGPDDATGVEVADALPAGLTFVSATPSTGTWSAGTWTIGPLANGASATMTLVATVAAPGAITNTATVAGDQYDTNPANNSASASTDQLVDLRVTKTVNDATPNVGAVAIFTVTVSNLGPGAATNVVIHDPAPTGLSYVDNTPSQGSYAGGDWAVGTIANGASATLSIDALVVGSDLMTNTASVKSLTEPQSSTANDSASASVTPPHADLEVVKTVADARPEVKTDDSFTITLTNHGSAQATNVAVTDLLPTGLLFKDATPSQGTYVDSTGVWTVGTVAAGASATLTIGINADVDGDYTNTATVTASDQYDPNPDNNTDTADLSTRVADIAVTKTPSDATPNVGATIDFTVVATNNGPDGATQLVVHDALPSGFAYVSHVAAAGTTFDPTTGDWTIGGLANGANTTLTITARVVDSGTLHNTAAVSHLLQRDLVPANDSDTATVTVPPAADLSLTKLADNDSPDKGTNVTFTLTVVNHGPDGPNAITVNDALPAGLTYISDTGAGAYDPATGDWTVGGLAKGDSAALQITASVDVEGPIVNIAEVTHSALPDPDSTPGNGVVGEDDRATASLNARGVADLSLAKEVNGTKAIVGAQLTYTIAVTNHGPDGATGVVVRDTLPAGVTFVSSAGGTYNHTTGAWTVGSLGVGASASLTITVRVGQAGSIVNTAEVVAENQHDPNSIPDDNVASENDQGSASILGAHATPPPTVIAHESAPAPNGSMAVVLGSIALAIAGFFLIVASRRYAPVRVRPRRRLRRRK